MWNCNICSNKTRQRGNVIRHIKLVYEIEDRDARNASKDSNMSVKSSHDRNTPFCSNLMSGRPLFEEINPVNDREQLQDGGLYDENELHRHQPRMEHDRYKAISNPVNGLYTTEPTERFRADLRRKKCHISDCVLDTFPEHPKAKAKSMCDHLKCQDRIFINPGYELVIDGELDRGSNIRDYIMDSLTEPTAPGSLLFKQLEKENKRLKQILTHQEKALAQAKGESRCRKFESIIDGTVDRCDYSDDTNSDEDSEEEDDTDENEDGDDEYATDEEDDEEDDCKPRHSKKKKFKCRKTY